MHASNDNAGRPSFMPRIKVSGWQSDILETKMFYAVNDNAPSGFAAIVAAVQAATGAPV